MHERAGTTHQCVDRGSALERVRVHLTRVGAPSRLGVAGQYTLQACVHLEGRRSGEPGEPRIAWRSTWGPRPSDGTRGVPSGQGRGRLERPSFQVTPLAARWNAARSTRGRGGARAPEAPATRVAARSHVRTHTPPDAPRTHQARRLRRARDARPGPRRGQRAAVRAPDLGRDGHPRPVPAPGPRRSPARAAWSRRRPAARAATGWRATRRRSASSRSSRRSRATAGASPACCGRPLRRWTATATSTTSSSRARRRSCDASGARRWPSSPHRDRTRAGAHDG